MAFLRKVRTASGATAVQIAVKDGRRDKVIEHLGSAHTEAELAALMQIGRAKLHGGQDELDLGLDPGTDPRAAVLEASASRMLIEVIRKAYSRLGFDVVGDEAFFQLVLARLVEPTSKVDSIRVLSELGVSPAHRNTFTNALKRCAGRDYRDQLAQACFTHAAGRGALSLVLYDVTTLYFEAEKEDDLRKVGYSKERRVDPQIVVGLLVDRTGFPLEIGCFEGNHAETRTLIPIISQFTQRHDLEQVVVVADAGMLSAANLGDLDDAHLRFIVGSRVTKAPADLESHFRWNGDAFGDGQVIDTVTARHANTKINDPAHRDEPVWDPGRDTGAWRAVWQYSGKRAVRDTKTLNQQEQRAQAIIEGEKKIKTARFVK
ncbi:transposase, partial [Cellulomonas bogoriensis 69B4 = DSM 16987]